MHLKDYIKTINNKAKIFDLDNNIILKENKMNDSLMATNNISKTKEYLKFYFYK